MKTALFALNIAVSIFLFAGFGVDVYFALTNGEPNKAWWWLLGIVFFAWEAVPFVGLALINCFLCTDIVTKIVLLIAALLITCGGSFILYDAFVTHLDAQSGIVCLFMPFFQCVVVVIALSLVLLIKAIRQTTPLHSK